MVGGSAGYKGVETPFTGGSSTNSHRQPSCSEPSQDHRHVGLTLEKVVIRLVLPSRHGQLHTNDKQTHSVAASPHGQLDFWHRSRPKTPPQRSKSPMAPAPIPGALSSRPTRAPLSSLACGQNTEATSSAPPQDVKRIVYAASSNPPASIRPGALWAGVKDESLPWLSPTGHAPVFRAPWDPRQPMAQEDAKMGMPSLGKAPGDPRPAASEGGSEHCTLGAGGLNPPSVRLDVVCTAGNVQKLRQYCACDALQEGRLCVWQRSPRICGISLIWRLCVRARGLPRCVRKSCAGSEAVEASQGYSTAHASPGGAGGDGRLREALHIPHRQRGG
jgi:hypothetical protein